MSNFWDFNVWGFSNLLAILLLSLLAANMLKKWFPFLQKSLIPTSVLGGAILLHERMTSRELLGCAVMFAAIILVQLPAGRGAENQKQA